MNSASRGNTGHSKAMFRLVKFLMRGPASEEASEEASEKAGEDGLRSLRLGDGACCVVPAALLAEALMSGLAERAGGAVRLGSPARSYLRRAAAEQEEAFLNQHAAIGDALADVEGTTQRVRLNSQESPLAGLSRLKDRSGGAFLREVAVAAGERLLADFTRGQLQPRVTASWEPRLSGRAKGSRGGMPELTDSATAARIAVNRALQAVGPELSGVALDVCCFMKGLETVERERQWPAGPLGQADAAHRAAGPVAALQSGSAFAPSARRALGSGGVSAGIMTPERRGRTRRPQAAARTRASSRIRLTIERRPFERCEDRFSTRPTFENTSKASSAAMSEAVLPE